MADSGSWNSLHRELQLKILSYAPDEDLARFAAANKAALSLAADVVTMRWCEWATLARDYVKREYNMELHQVGSIVFRGDTRSPEIIFRLGFTPHPDFMDAPRPYFSEGWDASTSHVVSTSRDLSMVKQGYESRGGFIYAMYCKNGFDLTRRSQGNKLQEVAALQIPPKHVIAAIGPIENASHSAIGHVSVLYKKVYVNPVNAVGRKKPLLFKQAIAALESVIGIGRSSTGEGEAWEAAMREYYRRPEEKGTHMICMTCGEFVEASEKICPDCQGTDFQKYS